jgi:hypothetical protein
MGKRLAGMIVEEAAWLDLQSALKDVILPALMDNEGWLVLISTTNAGQDGNQLKEAPSYFNRICQEIRAGERSDEWAEFHFTAEDNPKITAAPSDRSAEYAAGSAQLEQEVYAKLIVGGVGLALEQVEESKHIVPRFKVPAHWMQFGAFDWGFNHPYSFGWYAADEDGNVVKLDTLTGRKEQLEELAAKIEAAVPVKSLRVHRRRAGPGQRREGPRRVRPDVEGEAPAPRLGDDRREHQPRLRPAEPARLRGVEADEVRAGEETALRHDGHARQPADAQVPADDAGRPEEAGRRAQGGRGRARPGRRRSVRRDPVRAHVTREGRTRAGTRGERRSAPRLRSQGAAPEAEDGPLARAGPSAGRPAVYAACNWRAPRWDGSSDDMEEG